jgi:cell division protein FtsB
MATQFDFSLMSEDEIKAKETELTRLLAEKDKEIQALYAREAELIAKIDTVSSEVMPFLENLTKQPEKKYIYWENRTEQMSAFIDKLVNVMK